MAELDFINQLTTYYGHDLPAPLLRATEAFGDWRESAYPLSRLDHDYVVENGTETVYFDHGGRYGGLGWMRVVALATILIVGGLPGTAITVWPSPKTLGSNLSILEGTGKTLRETFLPGAIVNVKEWAAVQEQLAKGM